MRFRPNTQASIDQVPGSIIANVAPSTARKRGRVAWAGDMNARRASKMASRHRQSESKNRRSVKHLRPLLYTAAELPRKSDSQSRSLLHNKPARLRRRGLCK